MVAGDRKYNLSEQSGMKTYRTPAAGVAVSRSSGDAVRLCLHSPRCYSQAGSATARQVAQQLRAPSLELRSVSLAGRTQQALWVAGGGLSLAIQQSTEPERESGRLPEEDWGSRTRRSGQRSPQRFWRAPHKWRVHFFPRPSHTVDHAGVPVSVPAAVHPLGVHVGRGS